MNPNTAAILGALVADAAALGLHWLYDPARIKEIEAAKGLVFLPPDAADYAGAKGYFAHAGKAAGDASGYGEVCLLMLKHLAQHGGFQRVAYQTEYRAHFGPGGAFVGYIDAPTRLTLRTLLPLEPATFPAASGADDDQLPALAALPAVAATHSGSLEALLQCVEQVVRVTNHNDLAVAAAHCAAAALFAVLHGASVPEALTGAVPLAGDTLRPLLEEALTESAPDSDAVAERFGRACHVTQGLPVIFHIARHAPDYRHAIEANIRVGGDSCGRAILLGALMAARAAQQRGSAPVIPLPWLARYRKLVQAADACMALEMHAI